MADETFTLEERRETLLTGLRLVVGERAKYRKLPIKLLIIWLVLLYGICAPLLVAGFSRTGEMNMVFILIPAFWLLGSFIYYARRGSSLDRHLAPVINALFLSITDAAAFRRWLKALEHAGEDELLQAYFHPQAPFVPTITPDLEANDPTQANQLN